ncbi:MAG: DNA translocase FtsK 4TM domain-containing protein [Thermomicrobiales bacterium]
MATSTRVRASQPKSKQTSRKQARPETPTSRLTSIRDRVPIWLHARRETEKRRRRLIGAILLSLGIVAIWLLVAGHNNGAIASWIQDAMQSIAGQGAFLIPLVLIMVGLRGVLRNSQPILFWWHIAGACLLILSLLAIFALSHADRHEGGGVIGHAAITLTNDRLTEIPAAFLFLGIGGVGVFLLSRITPWTLVHEITDITAAARTSTAPVVAQPPRKTAARPNLEVPPPPVSKEEMARAQQMPLPPIINLPKNTVPAATKKKPAPMPARAAENLPLPELTRLHLYEGVEPDTVELEAKARLIEETLTSFKVDAYVREINPGPTVTQYTLEPGTGVKVRRITELQNDLALAMAAPSIRIEAPVPGMARVGIEIPNENVSTVGLREMLESPAFQRSKGKLPVPLGRDVNGKYIVHDIAKMPHVLIAGATGSGKSVCINTIISTFMLTRSPSDLRLLMIDPKMVELTGYNGVPHLQCPVITEMDKVVGALRLVVQEMQRRYDLFNKNGVRNLDGYRLKIEDEPKAEKVPYLVVIIDELADLMLTSPMDVETLLQRIAQMGRAAGIHLILATQRPSVDVVTGVIKANVPTRIAFAVSSQTDSRVILDMPGAERLLGRGDMLFLPPDAAKPSRIQGAFIEDDDVHYLVQHWHSVAPLPKYAEEWLNLPSSSGGGEDDLDGEDDPLMEKALEVVRSQGVASASMLQRRLRIGYNRAARLIEQMEAEGIIGPADGIKGRPLLTDDF